MVTQVWEVSAFPSPRESLVRRGVGNSAGTLPTAPPHPAPPRPVPGLFQVRSLGGPLAEARGQGFLSG